MIGEQFDWVCLQTSGCSSSDAMNSENSMASTLTLTRSTPLRFFILPRSSLGGLLPERMSLFRQPLLRPGLFASEHDLQM